MLPKRKAKTAPEKTNAVSSSRFKSLKVSARCSIREFVEKNKLKFAAGRGFYQLTKPETIQFHKEIVARRTSDGLIITGDEVLLLFDIMTLYITDKVRTYLISF